MNTLLPLTLDRQQGQNWCWASVTAGVRLFHYGDTVEQCIIASRVLRTDCCPELSPCDVESRLDIPLATFGCLARPPVSSPLPPNHLVHQIATLRAPVCAQISREGPTHFVVIHGVRMSPALHLAVFDPLTGPATHPYNEFIRNYQGEGGRWIYTYLTGRVTS